MRSFRNSSRFPAGPIFSALPELLKEWPEDIDAAIFVQQSVRQRVDLANRVRQPDTIAGVDVGYDITNNRSRAVIAVLDYATLELRQSAVAYVPTTFPYVPGFLSFREIPAILTALSCLRDMPDVLMVDGQGIAHPRRLGIAAHLGALLDWPALGVAKSRLTGRSAPLSASSGEMTDLMDKQEKIGTVLRSKEKCLPLFISPGHGIDQETALRLVRHCLRGYRLPEPTRIADKLSKHEK
jgi:deoxyribonuclease V